MEENKNLSPHTPVSGLGKALVQLNLDENFIYSGKISKFPLSQRTEIINEILSEKLDKGKWESVIDLFYSPKSKINQLYEDSPKQLNQKILDSAIKSSPKKGKMSLDHYLISTLIDAKEQELLFNLATNLPLEHEKLSEISSFITSPDYFNQKNFSLEKRTKLINTLGKSALETSNYKEALQCFLQTGNQDGIEEFFSKKFNREEAPYVNISLLEAAATSDPEKQENRLNQVAMGFKFNSVSPIDAFNIKKKYDLGLPSWIDGDLAKSISKLGKYELEHNFPENEPHLKVKWAEEHLTEEPRLAYMILKEHEPKHPKISQSILAGLSYYYDPSSDKNKEKLLRPEEINESDLKQFRKNNPSIPFNIEIGLARYLKDKEELLSLGRSAERQNDFSNAYRLFLEGGGNTNDEYVKWLRQKIIQENFKAGSFNSLFVFHSDKEGLSQAYEHISQHFNLESDLDKKKVYLKEMYSLADSLSNEHKLDETRKLMASTDPSWALRYFSYSSKNHFSDKKGIDYVLSYVSKSTGFDKNTLEGLLDK